MATQIHRSFQPIFNAAQASAIFTADTLGIPLNGVSVSVSGRLDLRGFFAIDERLRPGFKEVTAKVNIDSPAPAEEIERLRASVDRHCPVLGILRSVTPVRTRVEQSTTLQRPAA